MSYRSSRARAFLALPAIAWLLLGALSCDAGRLASPSSIAPPETVTPSVLPGQVAHFYVTAFVEDWQLYMGDRLPSSLTAASQVTFVFTSSGDKNSGMAYVQMRESAGASSIDTLLHSTAPWTCGTTVVSAHPIRRCTKGPVVAYYMRLPDGAMTGEGYAGRGSMSMLRDGAQATLVAIDGTTTYTSWSDLYSTIRTIVDTEGANQVAPYIVVNTIEYDRTTNAGDHPDRLATADAVHSASASRNWNLTWFLGSPAQTRAVNLTQAQHDLKAALFDPYDAVVGAAGYGHPKYDSDVQAAFWRTYSRSSVAVPPPPPAAPSALQSATYSSTRVDLTWTNNASNATSIDIERAPDVSGAAGTFAVIGSVGATTSAYSAAGLSATTTYWFRVRARNATDVSTYSNAVSATTATPPAAPTGLSATVASSSRISLAWTDVATSVTGYSVERAPDVAGTAGTYAAVVTLPANATSYVDGGLTGSTRYWYRVRAVSATDVSAYSNAASATTNVAPITPTNFTATAFSATRIDLAWTDVTGENGYVIQRAPDNSGVAGTWAIIASLASNVVSYSDQAGLAPATRYWYRILSTTPTDSSAYTAAVSATTLDVPPAAPSSLTATAASSTRINLAWIDNSTNESGFLVERAPDAAGVAGAYATLATLVAGSTSYSDQSLTPSTRYWYRVRATNSAGNSAYTNATSATTLAPPVSHTEVYVHAHQDDWQLFMGEAVNTSLQTATKVVLVYTSAGDANLGSAYWRTREVAARNAVDALLAPGGSWTCGSQVVNTHPIQRCVRGIAVSYFMRLPDGASSGEGFSGRGSIGQLRDGYITSLSAMDSSTTYTSWADLTNTLGALIALETNNLTAPALTVDGPEYDRTLNAGDHPDHLATADLLRAAALTHSWNLGWYRGYITQNLAINETQAVHDIKQAAFYAYDNTMGQAGYGYSRYESNYQAWLWRSYSRQVAAP